MTYTYRFPVTANLGKLIPSVGAMMDSVNETMRGFGFNEKASLRSEVMELVFTCNACLPLASLDAARSMIQATLHAKFPEMEYVVDVPRTAPRRT